MICSFNLLSVILYQRILWTIVYTFKIIIKLNYSYSKRLVHGVVQFRTAGVQSPPDKSNVGWLLVPAPALNRVITPNYAGSNHRVTARQRGWAGNQGQRLNSDDKVLPPHNSIFQPQAARAAPWLAAAGGAGCHWSTAATINPLKGCRRVDPVLNQTCKRCLTLLPKSSFLGGGTF